MTPVDFLAAFHAGRRWQLLAINNGRVAVEYFDNASAAEAWIEKREGQVDLYFAINPLRPDYTAKKKATKADVAEAAFLFADIDPPKGCADLDAWRASTRTTLAALPLPAPTWLIDSGRGFWLYWELDEPATVAEAEAEGKAIAAVIGGCADACWNVDRIGRLPGTTNCKTYKAGAVLEHNDVTYCLDDFDVAIDDAGIYRPLELDELRLDEILLADIKKPDWSQWDGDRSRGEMSVISRLKSRGVAAPVIVEIFLTYPIGEKTQEQRDPRAYIERQLSRTNAGDFVTDEKGKIIPNNQNNVRTALAKLGVVVRYNEFCDHIELAGLDGFGPVLDDAALTRIWLTIDARFRFRPSQGFLQNFIFDAARLASFHPVRDYLAGLQWDGAARLDRWLVDYAGAVESDYVRAVGSLMLTAAVRRVRKPGVKFDEMVVLESPTQGTDKSSALATLAVHDEWFSDDLPLNVEGKRVIEALRGKWIIEAAELSGMRKADVEHVKALLSRTVDRGRLSYDRIVSNVPRQAIFVATTNSEKYLRDTSGNRRFWPVRVDRFDVKALRRDRDQLWAEAAAREASGVRSGSILNYGRRPATSKTSAAPTIPILTRCAGTSARSSAARFRAPTLSSS